MSPEKEARIELLKALGKLAVALAPLAVAMTYYFEQKTEALRASINATQEATAQETATSSVAYGAMVERLELHERALEDLAKEAAALRAVAGRQGSTLARHSDQLAGMQRLRNPVDVAAHVADTSSDGHGRTEPMAIMIGPDGQEEVAPLEQLKRIKMKKARPKPSAANVRQARQQISEGL